MDIDNDGIPDTPDPPPLLSPDEDAHHCLCAAGDVQSLCGGTTKHCSRPQRPASPPVFDAENPFLNQATYLRILDIQHDEVKARLDKLLKKAKHSEGVNFTGTLEPTVFVRMPCWGKFDREVAVSGRGSGAAAAGIHFMVSETPVQTMSEDEFFARPLWIPDTPDSSSSPASSVDSMPFSSTPSLTDSPLSHATTPSPPLLDVAAYKLLPHALVSSEGKMSQKAGITKKSHHNHHHHNHIHQQDRSGSRSRSRGRTDRSPSRKPSSRIHSPATKSPTESYANSSSYRSSIRITTLWKSDDPKFTSSFIDEMDRMSRGTYPHT